MTDNLKTVTARELAWMLAAYVNRAITLEEVRQLQLVKKKCCSAHSECLLQGA